MDTDTVEEIKRHFGIIAEGLRSDIRVIAEGQDLLREQLTTKIDGVDRRGDSLDRKIDGVERKVDGIAQIVQLTYSEVTGRLNDHEARLDVLERRQP